MSASALRAILRLGWRDTRRHPGRSLLVLILILLPVTGVAGGAALLRTVTPSLDELVAERVGQADLVLWTGAGEITREDLVRSLPEGAHAALIQESQAVVRGQETVAASVYAMDLTDPVFEGHVALLEGRSPTSMSEAAVSPTLLEMTGRSVGDELVLHDPARTLTITGIAALAGSSRQPLIVTRGPLPPPDSYHTVPGDRWLAVLSEANDIEEAAARLRSELLPSTDASVVTRSDEVLWLSDRSERPVSAVFVVGALALVQAAVIASAAFGVAVRREVQALGLLGAIGATRHHLRSRTLANAALIGGIAAVIGPAVGILGARLVLPHLDAVTDRLTGPLDVRIFDAAGAGLLGLLAAVAAAWYPARAAGRVPPVVALAGRRPASAPSRRSALHGLPVAGFGAILVVLGAAHPASQLTIVAGSALVVIGLSVAAPAAVTLLGPVAPRVPMSIRIGLRDVIRHRARSGAAVAAVMAGLALPIAIVTFARSTEARTHAAVAPVLREDQLLVTSTGRSGEPEPPGAEVLDLLAEHLHPLVAAPLSVAGRVESSEVTLDPAGRSETTEMVNELLALGAPFDGGETAAQFNRFDPATGDTTSWHGSPLALGDSLLLQAMGGDEARVDFESGKVIAFGLGTTMDGRIEVGGYGEDRDDAIWLDAVEIDVAAGQQTGIFLLSRTAADEMRIGMAYRGVLMRTEGPIDHDALAEASRNMPPGVYVTVHQPVARTDSLKFQYAGAMLATVLTLLIVAVATILSLAESRRDHQILSAVGAAPSTRRRLAAAHAGSLALLGGLLAVPAGLTPVVAVLATRAELGYSVVVPWDALAAAVLVLPTLAALVAAALTRQQETGTLRLP